MFSSRTINLPSLKLLGQIILELSVAQGEVNWHDLWPWPTDLNMNRGHLFIKDYLPTKFEVSGAKRSWVISCTRWSKLAWPLILDLLTWISIGIIYSSRGQFWGKEFPSYPLQKVWETDMTFDLNMNRDHLLIKVYVPNKFEASGAKRSCVISCTRLRDADWHVQRNMPLLLRRGA